MNMSKIAALIIVAVTFCRPCHLRAGELPQTKEFTNSIGMKLVRIESGMFRMGQLSGSLPFEMMPEDGGPGNRMDALIRGDFDEKLVHKVTISKPFHMAVCEVANKQYELFDPAHKALRGKDAGLSKGDDDAVINVSWYDAQAFCQWLSDKEGLPYRLPTEAEWEYACRAGTDGNFFTGQTLPKEFRKNQWLIRGTEFADLRVGATPPNPWGLYDMHGNVEEWCNDWYGPYLAKAQTDPLGYAEGDFRVTRGGSHSTDIYYLRSANRMGALPEDKHWLLGFRVALGELPGTKPIPQGPAPLNQQNVVQRNPDSVKTGPNPNVPYFAKPRTFVRMPPSSAGPVFALHNHDPAIVECPNGDLLVCWYSCLAEKNRELCQAASRLRWGQTEWEEASPFWDVPDRNDHAPAMWFDGKETLYHFNGMSFGAGYNKMVIIMRTSKDSGTTWSRARVITPGHTSGHMPVEAVFRMHDDTIALTSDGSPTLWLSSDHGLNWKSCEGAIGGNHPGVTQLDDGRLFAFTRDVVLEGKMPYLISSDRGKTWDSKPSDFPPIHGGQRLVLLKLKEGPLFFASFAKNGIMITDADGVQRQVKGLFTAVSTDDGKTWPYRRLVSDDGPGTPVESMNGGLFTMSARTGEHFGYMSGCQAANGLVHLITSRTHYSFNLKWLMTPAAPLKFPPLPVKAVKESFDGPKFDNDGWVDYKSYTGNFNGKGQFSIQADGRNSGINRIVGEGSFEAVLVLKNLLCHPAAPRGLVGAALVFEDGLGAKQGDYLRRGDIGSSERAEIKYDKIPETFKLKTVWNHKTKQWRVFYGFNGEEPLEELPASKAGIFLKEPFTEATSCYLMAANGSVDVDYFEIKPLND